MVGNDARASIYNLQCSAATSSATNKRGSTALSAQFPGAVMSYLVRQVLLMRQPTSCYSCVHFSSGSGSVHQRLESNQYKSGVGRCWAASDEPVFGVDLEREVPSGPLHAVPGCPWPHHATPKRLPPSSPFPSDFPPRNNRVCYHNILQFPKIKMQLEIASS